MFILHSCIFTSRQEETADDIGNIQITYFFWITIYLPSYKNVFVYIFVPLLVAHNWWIWLIIFQLGIRLFCNGIYWGLCVLYSSSGGASAFILYYSWLPVLLSSQYFCTLLFYVISFLLNILNNKHCQHLFLKNINQNWGKRPLRFPPQTYN